MPTRSVGTREDFLKYLILNILTNYIRKILIAFLEAQIK